MGDLALSGEIENPEVPEYASRAISLFWNARSGQKSGLPSSMIQMRLDVYQRLLRHYGCAPIEENICVCRQDLELDHPVWMPRGKRQEDVLWAQKEKTVVFDLWPESDRSTYVAVEIPSRWLAPASEVPLLEDSAS